MPPSRPVGIAHPGDAHVQPRSLPTPPYSATAVHNRLAAAGFFEIWGYYRQRRDPQFRCYVRTGRVGAWLDERWRLACWRAGPWLGEQSGSSDVVRYSARIRWHRRNPRIRRSHAIRARRRLGGRRGFWRIWRSRRQPGWNPLCCHAGVGSAGPGVRCDRHGHWHHGGRRTDAGVFREGICANVQRLAGVSGSGDGRCVGDRSR